MSHTGRSVVTATRKRKDVEDPTSTSTSKGSFGISHKRHHYQQQLANTTSSKSNHLLAGYMAYEFLTRGTLFGQKFDPARAEAVPVSAADSKRKDRVDSGSVNPTPEVNRTYAEVAQLIKSDGAHIPGVVNPTQLARWIQM